MHAHIHKHTHTHIHIQNHTLTQTHTHNHNHTHIHTYSQHQPLKRLAQKDANIARRLLGKSCPLCLIRFLAAAVHLKASSSVRQPRNLGFRFA